MNIFINAISIHGGGAFVVLLKLLQEMPLLEQNITWFVAADPAILAKLPSSTKIVKLPFTWANKSPVHLLFWYEIVLPRLLKKIKANLCFSQTNYLPRRKLSCPSLLLVQHAGHFSEIFSQLLLAKKNKLSQWLWTMKTQWVHQSIKRATLVTVQTQDLAQKIIDQVGILQEKIKVIAHGAGLLNPNSASIKNHFPRQAWRIGYITKYGVQKDFGTLFKAIQQLKQEKFPCKLVLTLDESTKEYKTLQALIHQYDIQDYIENHGEIALEKLSALYVSLDLFVFPSRCESFGFTLVEALAVGLPVIVADTHSNCEVIGEAGEIFREMDEKDLITKIKQITASEEKYSTLREKSLARASHYSWPKTSQELLTTIQQII